MEALDTGYKAACSGVRFYVLCLFFLSIDGWIPVLPSTFVNKNRSVSKEGQSRYGVAIRLDLCSLKIFLLPLDLGRGLTADWRHLLYISRFFWSHIRFAFTFFLPSFVNTYSYNSWLTDGISCTWIFATTYLRCLEFIHDRVLVPCFSLPDKPIFLLFVDSN